MHVPPLSLLIVPSGHEVLLHVTRLRSSPLRLPSNRSAPIKLQPCQSIPVWGKPAQLMPSCGQAVAFGPYVMPVSRSV